MLKIKWPLYDFLGLMSSGCLSYWIYLFFVPEPHVRVGPMGWGITFGVLGVVTNYLWELYESEVLADRRKLFMRVLSAPVMLGIFSILANYVLFYPGIGRIILLLSLLGGFVWQWSWRSLRAVFQRYRRPEGVVIIGHGEFAQRLCSTLEDSNYHPYKLAGIATSHPCFEGFGDVEVTDLAHLGKFIAENHVQHVLLVPGEEPEPRVLDDLIGYMKLGVRFQDAQKFYEALTGRIPAPYIDRLRFILEIQSIRSMLFRRVKRSFDFILAAAGIVAALPVALLIWLLIKLDSEGSVLYPQRRVGLNGRVFTLWKFRTMVRDAEDQGPRWACPDDLRTTCVGRVLRKLRLDELPQLWNILLGQMSFVGPRPERPEFVEMLSKEIAFYERRHLVRPGLTGWAQVCYPYGASVEDAREKLEYDLYYLKHQSLFMDLLILGRTLSTVVARRGAR